MDPQKQRQLINQMLQTGAKSEEELNNMTPEERKQYLQGRLKQKMFFSTAQRQSMHQKKQLQEKIQEKLENKETETVAESSAKTERNRRKRQKKREKLRAQKAEEGEKDEESEDDVVIVKDPNEDGSESDYHSD